MTQKTSNKTRLNGLGDIIVHRVDIGNESNGETGIAKTLAEGAKPTTRAEFDFERRVFAFLTEHCPQFTARPQVYVSEANYMLMSDLGTSQPTSERVYPISLADSMAQLHCASQGLGQQFGQATEANQKTKFSIEQCLSFAQTGQTLLGNILRQVCHESADTMLDLSEGVFKQVLNPGPFGAVIHHDLAAPRQWINTRDQCYLIDFELAKYTHVLLELSRLQLGSWEQDRQNRSSYKLKRWAVPEAFINHYKNRLFEGGQFAELQQDFAGQHQQALLFTLLLNLGVLDVAQEKYGSAEPLGACIVALLDAYLEGAYFEVDGEGDDEIEQYREVNRAIERAGQRISV
ncbi:MAG: hypothetical protein HRT35_00340 [Algicola sp.]|nr:hypothetical protein [Algicola sp.]